MQLDVPVFQQPVDSYECGPACLKMLLSYYGHPIDAAIAASFTYYTEGITIPQLGLYMMERGFAAEIVTLNPHLFPLQASGETDKSVIRDYFVKAHDRAKTDERRKVAIHLMEFLDAGGSYRVKIPDLSDVTPELEQGRPVVALLTTRCLHNKPGFNFHFNVVTGYDERGLYINDPMWDEMGGKHVIPANDFFYALHASAAADLDNASLLLIRPI